ncbi:MAG: nitrate reductase maturation protein NarM [Leptolyngbyaceae cyanobacterium RM2_2_4]|nr:nitrate reductase maturation protein NarM [Leptolyngbyaceae cyanobacterium SM1_4_3]NJN89818.1 nitrate reductase maturation protein NarM [Leptolyngbyaceae cyanobacterium SL_5_14]NJO51360.1 nitrate reductase maturation protein NarM [Leptolyngbyaceae cyanobacterium RM2_2_4]NJO66947.1 nitrate reductase maturation protein NarM [Leptolyngbyaceae cyanobacterium RM1_405_57]
MQTRFFQFEADFVDSLRCIPMQVRLKLDTCGIKLKLPQWHRFSDQDRQTLVDLPCETEAEVRAYCQLLQRLILERTGEVATELAIDPHPAWNDTATVADSVQTRASESSVTITPAQWANLSPEQRFALIKLSRSSHENANFLPALQEFQII